MKIKIVLCHRNPQRTFKIFGIYFPVCSRCTGIYLGIFFYMILFYLFPVRYNLSTIIISTLLIIPTFIDGLSQLYLQRESNNLIRFSTGLIGGIGLGIIVTMPKVFLSN